MANDNDPGRRTVLGGLAALGAGLGMFAMEQEASAAGGAVKLSFFSPRGEAIGKITVPTPIARAMAEGQGVQFKVEINGVTRANTAAKGYIKFDGIPGD